MKKLVTGVLVVLFLVAATTLAEKSQKISAKLVETFSMPTCYGLDCPPWPVPDEVHFCFQVNETYYTGEYQPRLFPWETKGKKLRSFEGQFVEISILDHQIRVVDSRVKLNLMRTHKDGRYKSPACGQA